MTLPAMTSQLLQVSLADKGFSSSNKHVYWLMLEPHAVL